CARHIPGTTDFDYW
nr:immunoglobulin heavy chain junction region [Macaca mulatta]MOX93917.1 immunoglobulin heavy chain junction region [Macaca mulatta]